METYAGQRGPMMKKIALAALALFACVWAAEAGADEYFTNASGHRVHRTVHASYTPKGATARCRDGSFSFSEHHQGTCSHDGGVAVWP
jgi:hypothetical protein